MSECERCKQGDPAISCHNCRVLFPHHQCDTLVGRTFERVLGGLSDSMTGGLLDGAWNWLVDKVVLIVILIVVLYGRFSPESEVETPSSLK